MESIEHMRDYFKRTVRICGDLRRAIAYTIDQCGTAIGDTKAVFDGDSNREGFASYGMVKHANLCQLCMAVKAN